MLSSSAGSNATDRPNLTPVGWATIIKLSLSDCSIGDRYQKIREYLLSIGAQLDIFSGIALNQSDLVRSLIEANPEILTHRLGLAKNESQPLHFAVEENMTQMVELGGRQRFVNFTPISPSNLCSDRVVRF